MTEYNMRNRKIMAVLEVVRQHSQVLVDDFGNPRSFSEIVARLGLNEVLTPAEQWVFQMELKEVMEAQHAAAHVQANMP